MPRCSSGSSREQDLRRLDVCFVNKLEGVCCPYVGPGTPDCSVSKATPESWETQTLEGEDVSSYEINAISC